MDVVLVDEFFNDALGGAEVAATSAGKNQQHRKNGAKPRVTVFHGLILPDMLGQPIKGFFDGSLYEHRVGEAVIGAVQDR